MSQWTTRGRPTRTPLRLRKSREAARSLAVVAARCALLRQRATLIPMRTPGWLLVVAMLVCGCGGGEKPSVPLPGTEGALSLASTAFSGGKTIPRRYTCDGDGVSPPLSWSGVPRRARELVLVGEDRDADRFVHWTSSGSPRREQRSPMTACRLGPSRPTTASVRRVGELRVRQKGPDPITTSSLCTPPTRRCTSTSKRRQTRCASNSRNTRLPAGCSPACSPAANSPKRCPSSRIAIAS